MASQDNLVDHILESLYASMAESEGHEQKANQLHAQTRLRLLAMSDEGIWELAKLLSLPKDEPVKCTYEKIKQATREHAVTAVQWMKDL